MPRSLLLVLPALLLAAPVHAATRSQHSSFVSSGRSASHGAREAWFRQCVGDILEGRVASKRR